MIAVNISYHMLEETAERFLGYIMKQETDSLERILTVAEPGTVSFCVRKSGFESICAAERWLDSELGTPLREDVSKHFGENVLFFTTLLEEIEIARQP